MKKRKRGRPRGTIGSAAIITNEQFVRVCAIARRSGRYAARAETALLLSYELGLRAGELAVLTVGDLFEADERVRTSLLVGRRVLPLSSPRLRKGLADYRVQNFAPDVAPNAYLFFSQRGPNMTCTSLARELTTLYKAAGIVGGSSRSGKRSRAARYSCPGPTVRPRRSSPRTTSEPCR